MKVIELSIKILKEFSFNINEVDKLRSELVSPYNTGVYVLREGNSFLYVGMSNSLRNRITEHLNGVGSSGEFVDRIDRIEVFITENNSYADLLETYLIMSNMPKFNIDKKPIQPISIVDTETELFEIDEEIEFLQEKKRAIRNEYDPMFWLSLNEDSVIYHELKAIDDEIEELRDRRRIIRREGARPMDNVSYFADSENGSMWKI